MIRITDPIIDSRDVIDRIEDLEDQLDDTSALADDQDLQDELDIWRLFQQEGDPAEDWAFGVMFIADDHFVTYAQELAEDIGSVPRDDTAWPFTCIDWEAAAEALQVGYTPITVAGRTFWARF